MSTIPATGLTILHDPLNAQFDIIFIHGFNGHPNHTWSTSGPPAPVLWPRDLLPDSIPHARVLTYGYDDTRVRHAWSSAPPAVVSSPSPSPRPGKGTPAVPSTSAGKGTSAPPTSPGEATLDVVAGRLRAALGGVRSGKGEGERPVVFVVHSLGGLVVKELFGGIIVSEGGRLGWGVVRRWWRWVVGGEKGGNDPGGLLEATIGVVFFGTPHEGADPRRGVHRLVCKVGSAVGVKYNKEAVKMMKPGGTKLRELGDSFRPLAEGRGSEIHSFQEGTGLWWLFGQKVVPDLASRLGVEGETTEQIPRDHMEMCRFGSFEDPEYQKAVAAILRMTTAASEQVASRRQWIVRLARSLGQAQFSVLLLLMMQEGGALSMVSRSLGLPVFIVKALYILLATAWSHVILDVVPIRIKRGKRTWGDLVMDAWMVVLLGILAAVGGMALYYLGTRFQPQRAAPIPWRLRNNTKGASEVGWGGFRAMMKFGKGGGRKTSKSMFRAAR